MTPHKLLIVTDIDACFMDENYRYEDAMEAVQALQRKGYPLVFNSSKTLAELQDLTRELNLDTPIIAENGGIIAVPKNSELAELCQSSTEKTWQEMGSYWISNTALSRSAILKVAHELRSEHQFAFQGFADWAVSDVMTHTGLSEEKATLAKDRHVSEPILWQDTQERWQDFYELMQKHQIRALHGGRFIHLMSCCDKSDGLKAARSLYQKFDPKTDWTTMALGDSPNDLSMLEHADIAIIVPHPEGPRIPLQSSHMTYACYPASKGWNLAVLDRLQQF
ncbi:MAG: HAD-IIB family hydrolase [Rubritalea sp.]|uniref:HAD-IIB family hydrolase n=1 Tax=Rubritalea sp. TaxID=2109375 RepID=UPI00324232CE